MKLIEAIETYIERKRSQGFAYSTTGANLLSLGKSVGNLALERVIAKRSRRFLMAPSSLLEPGNRGIYSSALSLITGWRAARLRCCLCR